jgi:hypothetical protein
MALKLKFACSEYDRTIPFRTGDVKPNGTDFDYSRQPNIRNLFIDVKSREANSPETWAAVSQ